MHSAFLETATGWRLTYEDNEVLNHNGNVLFSDDEDEQDAHLAGIGAREGRFANLVNREVVLTDTKLHWGDTDAHDEVFATGSALVEHTSFQHKRGVFEPYPSHEQTDDWKAWVGVVAKKEGSHTRLCHDRDEWERLEAQRMRQVRKTHKKSLTRRPSKDDFWDVACDLASESGCHTKEMRLDGLCLWIFSHDTVLGKRVVNTHLRDLALRWCNDREKSRKWLGRWTSDTLVHKTDERLAAVCRLGDKNSRHKQAA